MILEISQKLSAENSSAIYTQEEFEDTKGVIRINIV
jgi:hypothetical protein